jgi:hypothetical protein
VTTDPAKTTDTPDPSVVTFLMVGCQRCGTTWVDRALREHPEVYLPAQKQTYFFDREHERGDAWYLSQFAGVRGQKAVGEVATGYCLVGAVPRMARLLPHVKLLMAVRHPVERAYSNYLSRKTECGWPSFEEAIKAEPDLLERGRYIEQVEAICEHYDRERLLVLLHEDLSSDDRAYLASILRFLGVDEGFESSQQGRQVNAAMYPGLRSALKRVGLGPALRVASKSPVGDALRSWKKRSGRSGYKPMNPRTREDLVRYYRPYNDRLSEWMGRDLSSWNE